MDTIESLKQERDEADRRAGAAERKLKRYAESEFLRETWTDRAKEQWGVHRNVSFDVVWEEALKAKQERDSLRADLTAARQRIEVLEGVNMLGQWIVPSSVSIVEEAISDSDVTKDMILILAALYTLADTTDDHAETAEADGFTLSAEETQYRADKYRQSYEAVLSIWADAALSTQSEATGNSPEIPDSSLRAENARLRQALETQAKAGYVAGYEQGHHDTVESQYGDAADCARDWWTEYSAALAPEPTPEQPTAEGSAE